MPDYKPAEIPWLVTCADWIPMNSDLCSVILNNPIKHPYILILWKLLVDVDNGFYPSLPLDSLLPRREKCLGEWRLPMDYYIALCLSGRELFGMFDSSANKSFSLWKNFIFGTFKDISAINQSTSCLTAVFQHSCFLLEEILQRTDCNSRRVRKSCSTIVYRGLVKHLKLTNLPLHKIYPA